MCRLVQHALLADDAAALRRLMPYIRCLNNFILDDKGLLQRTKPVASGVAAPVRDEHERSWRCCVRQCVGQRRALVDEQGGDGRRRRHA